MLKLETRRKADDRELIERAIQKDADAFGELYDMYVVRVYRHIYYLVGSINEAEDFTAQTFLQAWEAIHRYRYRGAPFLSWLLRIAHNLAISHLRSKREIAQLHDGLVDDKRDQDPERVAEQQVDEERVRQAMLRLRNEQRQVIMLRFVEGLDYREVASIVGKSVAAVRVIQYRALCALRNHMRAEAASAESSAQGRSASA